MPKRGHAMATYYTSVTLTHASKWSRLDDVLVARLEARNPARSVRTRAPWTRKYTQSRASSRNLTSLLSFPGLSKEDLGENLLEGQQGGEQAAAEQQTDRHSIWLKRQRAWGVWWDGSKQRSP